MLPTQPPPQEPQHVALGTQLLRAAALDPDADMREEALEASKVSSFDPDLKLVLNAGDRWEWGNGTIINSYYGSFPHSLLSTSKSMGNSGS